MLERQRREMGGFVVLVSFLINGGVMIQGEGWIRRDWEVSRTGMYDVKFPKNRKRAMFKKFFFGSKGKYITK